MQKRCLDRTVYRSNTIHRRRMLSSNGRFETTDGKTIVTDLNLGSPGR